MLKRLTIVIFVVFFFASVGHSQRTLAEPEKCEDKPAVPTLGTVTRIIRLPVPKLGQQQTVESIAPEKILVEITINKKGRVISAVATSGDFLLKSQAIRSARKMTFPRVGRKVKNRKGTILYNFVPTEYPNPPEQPSPGRFFFIFKFLKSFAPCLYLLFRSLGH